MLEHIDTSLIDWSRAQFALTAIYHWIFVPLTLGLAVIMVSWRPCIIVRGMSFGNAPPSFGGNYSASTLP